MTAKEVLTAMAKGSVLCMEFSRGGRVYWLEPKRTIVRADVAEQVIRIPGVSSGGDSLFKDDPAQTWRVRR